MPASTSAQGVLNMVRDGDQLSLEQVKTLCVAMDALAEYDHPAFVTWINEIWPVIREANLITLH